MEATAPPATPTTEVFGCITVTWTGQPGSDIADIVFDDKAFNKRIAALRPFTRPGQGYIRGVADNIREAERHRHNAGLLYEPDLFDVEIWLDKAECLAGVITERELGARYQARIAASTACTRRSIGQWRSTGLHRRYTPPQT